MVHTRRFVRKSRVVLPLVCRLFAVKIPQKPGCPMTACSDSPFDSPSDSPAGLTAALVAESHRLGFDVVGATPAVVPPRLDYLKRWVGEGFAGEMRWFVSQAEAYQHPQRLLAGARGVLMLGVNYRTAEPVLPVRGEGRVSRYAWGDDYHTVIRRRLRRLEKLHQRLRPGAKVRGVVDTAPIMEKQFAELSGLGWIGKHTLLVNERFGSWLFLAALLTTEELVSAAAPGESRCGDCRACLEACPTGALVAPYRLDARRCLSYCTVEMRGSVPAELRSRWGHWLFGCDACQEACPWNRTTPLGTEQAFWPRPGMNPLPLAPLMELDEAGWRDRFRGTALLRARHQDLLRNAEIVLQNQSR
jgi:epoxyqueuosine reductase